MFLSHIGNKHTQIYIYIHFNLLELVLCASTHRFDFRKDDIHFSLLFQCADKRPHCSSLSNNVSIC